MVPFSSLKECVSRWQDFCEKAKEVAKRLGFEDFKASNGWLNHWKKRHHIKQMTVSGESGDVSGATIDSWKERLPLFSKATVLRTYGI